MLDLLVTSRREARKGGKNVTLKYIVALGDTVFGNTFLVLVLANFSSQEEISQTLCNQMLILLA